MSRIGLLTLLLSVSFSLFAQDTLSTNYPDSKKVWKKVYSDSKKTQDLIYWENGREWMTARYDSADVEYWKWYHENGNPYWKATIIRDELQGVYKIWYESGQLAEEVIFLNHLEDGPAVFYYENGQIASTGNYENGKMVGHWQFYDQSGNSFDGQWSWPFAAETETNRMEGTIENGKRVGVWIYQTTAGGKKRRKYSEQFQ